MKIVLYGAGRRGISICRLLRCLDIDNIIIVDRDKEKWGTYIEEYLVTTPEILSNLDDIYLCITLVDKEETKKIRDNISTRWGNKVKEIPYRTFILQCLRKNSSLKQHILSKKIEKASSCNYLFDCYDGLVLGGIEAWTKDVCQALIMNGHERTYIISKTGEYMVPDAVINNILYIDRLDGRDLYKDIVQLIEMILDKLPCTIVTGKANNVLFAAGVVKYYFPELIHVCTVIHCDLEELYTSYIEMKECTDIYVGVCQDIRDEVIERGISPSRIYVMTCPFPCEKDLERTYTLDNNEPIHIGYAGRMDGFEHSQKRMDLLLKLIKELDDRNVNFCMELAGDGPVRMQMEKYTHENELGDRVVFLGTIDREDIPAFWRRQDICVNTADYEGRCISKLEAMANGAVPIVTETAGMREDVKDGENGYIVPIGDYLTMADRIQYLSKHRDRLPEMGQKAHDEVYPKSLMSEHLKFWENILEVRNE